MLKPSHPLILALVGGLLALSSPCYSQDQEDPHGPTAVSASSGQSETPWLDGVDLPTVPALPNPIYPCQMSLSEGGEIPATMSEDIPMVFQVESGIFNAPPPSTWEGQNLSNALWTKNPSINWQLTDLVKNKSFRATAVQALPFNQMAVAPPDPTGKGALTVFINREFTFEEKPGSIVRVFGSSSCGTPVKILDITPPLCGLEVSCGSNLKGTILTQENPINHYPLPKFGDVVLSGGIFTPKPEETNKTISHQELGGKLAIDPETGAVFLPKNGKVTLKPVLTDNDQVDDRTVRFGVCSLEGGVAQVIGKENPDELEMASMKLPTPSYLFVEARDVSGNQGSLFVPVKFR